MLRLMVRDRQPSHFLLVVFFCCFAATPTVLVCCPSVVVCNAKVCGSSLSAVTIIILLFSFVLPPPALCRCVFAQGRLFFIPHSDCRHRRIIPHVSACISSSPPHVSARSVGGDVTDARTSAEDAYMRTHRIFVRKYVRVCAVMCVFHVCGV